MGKSDGKSEKSFWETIPGIVIAIAALITAIGGCVAAVLGVPAITDRLFSPTATPEIFQTSTELPYTGAIVESPTKIYGFQTCKSLCTGQNSSKSFPEGINKIYAQFNYENFQPGIKYVRTWSLNGMEWIRYSCNWDGPISGIEVLTLNEPKGLYSGTWEIMILVNDAVVLKDQITVNGNWTYWDPAGTINACHGTID